LTNLVTVLIHSVVPAASKAVLMVNIPANASNIPAGLVNVGTPAINMLSALLISRSSAVYTAGLTVDSRTNTHKWAAMLINIKAATTYDDAA
jgi:hypothetical protein